MEEALKRFESAAHTRAQGAAALYVTEHGFSGPCRFDVLGLDREPTGWRATLIRNAFEARWR